MFVSKKRLNRILENIETLNLQICSLQNQQRHDITQKQIEENLYTINEYTLYSDFIPGRAKISFEMPLHDWNEFKKSDEWQLTSDLLDAYKKLRRM